MGKYYAYARVSTKDQSDNSLENQIKYLRIKARELQMEFIGLTEKASGKTVSGREVLTGILQRLESGDVLGVYDNSRLGRDTEENLRIVKELAERDVNVQVNGKIIDPNNPNDKLLLTIESAVSTFQRENQLLKSKIGIASKKEKGDWIFTSRLFGYNVTMKRNSPSVEIIEEEAEILRFIFKRYAAGDSIKQITEAINKNGCVTRSRKPFHPATVRRYILKPIYKGYYKVEGAGSHKGQDKVKLIESGLVKSNYYPAIIHEDLWDLVQKSYRGVKREHARQFEYKWSDYELTSILKCGYCRKLGKPTSYVHCYHKQKRSNTVNENYVNRTHLKGCTQTFQTFRAEYLEGLFRICFFLIFLNLNELTSFIVKKKEEVESMISDFSFDIKRIENRIKQIQLERKNYIDAIANGVDIKHVANEIESRDEQEKELKSQLQEYKFRMDANTAEIEFLLDEYTEERLLKFLHASSHDRRNIYQEIIHSAYVYKERIVIRFTNSKVFVIPIHKHHGRFVQTEFEIKVFFLGKYQYMIRYDAKKKESSLIDVFYNPKKHQDEIFLQGYRLEQQQSLNELWARIENFQNVKTI